MKKVMGPMNSLYPMLTTIVGAMVNGKPNFITIAHVGVMDLNTISLGMFKGHYTNAGIKEMKTFSVNIPSIDIVEKTDYCGLVSGKKVDKSALFEVFYGKLKNAPMIKECPINMECKLVKTVDFPKHDIFMGRVMNTYYSEKIMSHGALDQHKFQPILFTMQDKGYWKLGERFADAWSVGKSLKEDK